MKYLRASLEIEGISLKRLVMMTGSQDKHKKLLYRCKIELFCIWPKKGIFIDLKCDEMFAPKIKLEKRGGGQK